MLKSLISTVTGFTTTSTANLTLNPEGEIIPENAKKLRRGVTTTIGTSLAVTLKTEYHNYQEYYNTAHYIKSLSDEELAKTLEELGLLEKKFDEEAKKLTKTRV